MMTSYNIFRENLYKACELYATESYNQLKKSEVAVKFTDSFTKRMLKLIKKVEAHYRSLHREKRRLFFVTTLSRVAMTFVIAIAVAVTITMSVEATRTSILDFLVEYFDDHIRITSLNMDPDGSYDISTAPTDGEELLEKYVRKLEELGFEIDDIEQRDNINGYMLVKDDNCIIISERTLNEYLIGTTHFNYSAKEFVVNNIVLYDIDNSGLWYWSIENSYFQLISDFDVNDTLALIRIVLNE